MSANSPAIHSNACPGATQVLRAARELFAEHGVDGVSMQDIATRARVSKANIFHHYASKEALHIAVLRDCIGQPSVSVADLIASTAPFEQRLLLLMQGEISDMLADEPATRLVVREVSQGNQERAQRLAREIFTEDIKARIAFFEDAKARGELRAGIEPMLADMLLGACCMFYFSCGRLCQHLGESIGHTAPASPAAYARAVCSVLAGGMAAPAPQRAVAPLRKSRSRQPAAKAAANAIGNATGSAAGKTTDQRADKAPGKGSGKLSPAAASPPRGAAPHRSRPPAPVRTKANATASRAIRPSARRKP